MWIPETAATDFPMKMPLKILHIGWGFYPWRKGGLILYARDLIYEQIHTGHKVSYFCPGRKLPILRKPFLFSWTIGKLNIYEIINSPIIHKGDSGTLNPELTLEEPFSHKSFRRVIQKVRPDIIHIHELAGLPSSIIDLIVDEYQTPCLMTLADYFLLCPCLKLYNHYLKENCTKKKIGHECLRCINNAPEYYRNDVFESCSYLLNVSERKFHLEKFRLWKLFRKFSFQVYAYFSKRGSKTIKRNVIREIERIKKDAKLKKQLQNRRDLNLNRLKKINLLVARSEKVKQIYDFYLDHKTKIIVVNPYLRQIDLIKQKQIPLGINKVKFVTLNGFISRQKGGEILLKAFVELNHQGFEGSFEMHSFGQIRQKYFKELICQSNFFDHGVYDGRKLDRLLSPMHVGIVPSIWEEVFGYVGLELLSKGLPVIANKKGGITDYISHDFNGYLNETCSVEELLLWMKKYIENKENIYKHNQNILNSWNKTYTQHYTQVMNIYTQLLTNAQDDHGRI